MKENLKQEGFLLLIAVFPLLYLTYLWPSIPERVPIHWGINGEIDGWGQRGTLWILASLSTFVYALMYLLSKADPKNRLAEMGSKLFQFRFVIAFFVSALFCAIIYTSGSGQGQLDWLVTCLVGLLFAGLGNHFQSLRPNYFMGIRTPWTLENEEVWKKTHRLAGFLWVAGGLLLALLSFLLTGKAIFATMMAIIGVMCIIPVAYSYKIYQAIKNKNA
jgi:uncharacterized membrane protein